MKRILSFDGIRAVAILGIVACHLCYATGHGVLGQYLGGSFNIIFFMISSLLIGLSNKEKSDMCRGGDSSLGFIGRRVIRLESSLFPFLCICSVIYLSMGVDFSAKAFIENVFMLGWFARLPGLGHLWFVTMILACYFMFSVLRLHREKFRKIWLWLVFIPLSVLLETASFPGYFFLIIMLCGLAFLYAPDIVKLLNQLHILPVLVVALISNVSVICMLKFDVISVGHLPYYYATALSGLCMFALLFKLFQIKRPGAILSLISGLSYEIYLIHHPLCQGPFNFFNLFSSFSPYIIVLFILVTSLVGSLGLHKLAYHIKETIQIAVHHEKLR